MTEPSELTSSSIIWYTGPEGAVARANPFWEAFTGQTFAEHVGWGWLDAIHPQDCERVVQAWQAGVARGQPIQLHYRLRRADGEYREVAAHGAPVAEAGAVREWVGVCIDLTDSRRALAGLRESGERLRLLDRLGQATRQLTDANRIMAVTAQMLGQALGATRCAYADVEPDGDRFTIRSDWAMPGVPSSVGVYSLDLFGPQATSNLRRGRHLVVRDVDRELGDGGGGRMFNAIGIKAIICAGLVKEERLVAMMAVHQAQPRDWSAQEVALVEEVVDRCWAHIERVRDNAMLREQDRRKDEFLATLAHELRNPLAPIRTAVQLLSMPSAPEPTRARATEIIGRQVGHMSRLLDDLIDIARITQRRLLLKKERVAAGVLVDAAVEAARPLIDAKRHQLVLRVADPSAVLLADPVRLIQVLTNLLNNAAKYSDPGGTITLDLRSSGGTLQLQVTDTGIGLTEAGLRNLFVMFSQEQSALERSEGGLGIGLALVKGLVELHGGTVAASSPGLGRGSCFTVQLPLAPATQPAAGAPAQQTGAAAAPRGCTVLLADDNLDACEVLAELLRLHGHAVRTAADGTHALQLALELRPDVLVLDIGMPGMNGYEVARQVRSQAWGGQPLLVAATGWGQEDDRQQALAAGFDTHLTKPFDPQLLSELIARRAS